MKFKISNNFNEKLKKLESLSTPERVSFDELFNEEFMKKYTNFLNITELLTKLNISSIDDIEKNIDALNLEIKSNSHFSSWEEMRIVAGREHFTKKINSIIK